MWVFQKSLENEKLMGSSVVWAGAVAAKRTKKEKAKRSHPGLLVRSHIQVQAVPSLRVGKSCCPELL
jgi:hypothetical protein